MGHNHFPQFPPHYQTVRTHARTKRNETKRNDFSVGLTPPNLRFWAFCLLQHTQELSWLTTPFANAPHIAKFTLKVCQAPRNMPGCGIQGTELGNLEIAQCYCKRIVHIKGYWAHLTSDETEILGFNSEQTFGRILIKQSVREKYLYA